MGVTMVFLATMFLARPHLEPWVSCKAISESLNKIDQSSTTVMASKFYVRGVRYFTDRDMAYIDVFGEGFFSQHPIPHLNADHIVLEFLDSQPFTYAILKEGNIHDLKRIFRERRQSYEIQQLDQIGGKYILRIERKEI